MFLFYFKENVQKSCALKEIVFKEVVFKAVAFKVKEVQTRASKKLFKEVRKISAGCLDSALFILEYRYERHSLISKVGHSVL